MSDSPNSQGYRWYTQRFHDNSNPTNVTLQPAPTSINIAGDPDTSCEPWRCTTAGQQRYRQTVGNLRRDVLSRDELWRRSARLKKLQRVDICANIINQLQHVDLTATNHYHHLHHNIATHIKYYRTNPNIHPGNNPTTHRRARTAFTASLRSVGTNYETALRDRARTLHENSSVLDKQEADVQRATEQLAKQNDQLAKVADQARDGLKEIGDVQNWAELIERDLLIVEETVRLAEEEEERHHHGNGNGFGEDGALEGNGRVNGFGGEVGHGDKDGKKGKGWFQWW
ncbi:hypothetical protein ABOM_010589 [Aspergillus bombycis]|uniref:Biogenesis of lysosome-related organelles complex 1 subunit 1 n=1 Tax=Aspergillus bombycis TaxID=109264 RepID=A0A1F7ZML0_9EURO|nr:hypothetical protein ABOM_010589 [Aspergillus bombycis]OGM40674.1 hypothetical protein ABOM_010589 [Aspergillus bombycis]